MSSQEIADSCSIELDFKKRHFPVFTPPGGQTSEDYLKELCLEGLKEQYADRPDRYKDGQFSTEVLDRLERELSVINTLGFPNYFLIVWDFVNFSREQKIEASARGSGVGSLVAYALHLSNVCPLEYDLLFERFLDLSRREAPDIDIDFCQQRRGEVIEYTKKRYGYDTVAALVAIKNADLETVALSNNRDFLALIERSRARAHGEGGISPEDMRRRFEPRA